MFANPVVVDRPVSKESVENGTAFMNDPPPKPMLNKRVMKKALEDK